MADENFKECLYSHPNRGDHPVVGGSTGIAYGYRSGGDVFLVHINDIAASPHLFVETSKAVVIPKQEVSKTPEPVLSQPSEKDGIAEQTSVPNRVYGQDIETLPGISHLISEKMKLSGIVTYDDVSKASDDQLLAFDGIGPAKVKAIRAYIAANAESK